MRKNMTKKPIVLVVAVIMLLTFATASQAHAFVPAVAWAIWGVVVTVGTIAAVKNETHKKELAKKEQHKASVQDQKADSEITPLDLQVQ